MMKLPQCTRCRKVARGFAVALLAVLTGYGVYARALRSTGIASGHGGGLWQWAQSGGVKTRAGLSQTKVIQGADGRVYLQIDMEADADSANVVSRRPTDFVVVLDRSGSMAEANKMDFAHTAIERLLAQMGESDRFALVSFDDISEVPVALTGVSDGNRKSLMSRVREVTPRGGTNLGAGLLEGIGIVKGLDANRSRRVLLLSDGLANIGVTDPVELAGMASAAVAGEFAVSTIGLGLDFNETLMSRIADHGMGNYRFLESTAGLDDLLAGEFRGAGQVFAQNLELRLNLADGVSVVDASGYPFDKRGASIVIRPGQLNHGQKKTVTVTLDLPTVVTYSRPLGAIVLGYRIDGKSHDVAVMGGETMVACVPPSRQAEAVASINKPVYDQAWGENNMGRMMKDTADGVRNGDVAGALSVIQGYKADLKQAYEAAPSPKLADAMAELNDKEEEVREAFTGADQDTKQKRLSKTLHSEGGGKQRATE